MTRRKLEAITPAMMDELLRRSFPAFVHRVVQHLSPGIKYQPNWHLDAAGYQLERVRVGELNRLLSACRRAL